ncbi:RAN protein kinase Ksp1 [Schizosaccharomyces octosporus yFS286]|uniref:RAN protein kinase Ksp1 n=1 Tax=Schizosaccharomyces octosporus (strain yFS286) TaxID=483514 RepID=S9R8K5_SCHOY|nr:RAN protein kinase Ksp1 [Schizosaccharomyces octosporus yFS286]EPX74530.1 RAN protein kinase Ksp1 [Schizosaccharomyces octosporus yFS286]
MKILQKKGYKVERPLNKGSYGTVVLAHRLFRTSRYKDAKYAIKCIRKPSPIFLDEVNILREFSRYRHRNIIHFVESFEDHVYYYVVLEYCPFGDLYECILNDDFPNAKNQPEMIKDIFLQVIDGVSHMHSLGIYHRDLKPENFLLSLSDDGNDLVVKISDFGLACRDTISHDYGTGSDRYMAPEQFEDVDDMGYSPRAADIWAIGICLLNLIFARNPFAYPNERDPIFADYVLDPMTLFDVFPTLSQDTYEVLRACLCVTPEKRSLEKTREAVIAVNNWTTDGEELESIVNEDDDFCPSNFLFDENIVRCTQSDREPLRTPSLLTPAATTQRGLLPSKLQPLSDLDENVSVTSSPQSPISPAAVNTSDRSYDSGLGESLKNMHISKPTPMPVNTKRSPYSCSAPAIVFPNSIKGNKDHLKFGRSWCDMDEEEEDNLSIGSHDNFGTHDELNAKDFGLADDWNVLSQWNDNA